MFPENQGENLTLIIRSDIESIFGDDTLLCCKQITLNLHHIFVYIQMIYQNIKQSMIHFWILMLTWAKQTRRKGIQPGRSGCCTSMCGRIYVQANARFYVGASGRQSITLFQGMFRPLLAVFAFGSSMELIKLLSWLRFYVITEVRHLMHTTGKAICLRWGWFAKIIQPATLTFDLVKNPRHWWQPHTTGVHLIARHTRLLLWMLAGRAICGTGWTGVRCVARLCFW